MSIHTSKRTVCAVPQRQAIAHFGGECCRHTVDGQNPAPPFGTPGMTIPLQIPTNTGSPGFKVARTDFVHPQRHLCTFPARCRGRPGEGTLSRKAVGFFPSRSGRRLGYWVHRCGSHFGSWGFCGCLVSRRVQSMGFCFKGWSTQLGFREV